MASKVTMFVQLVEDQPYRTGLPGLSTKLAQSFIAGKSPTGPVYLQVGALSGVSYQARAD